MLFYIRVVRFLLRVSFFLFCVSKSCLYRKCGPIQYVYAYFFLLLIIDSVLMAWRKLLLKTKTIAGNREQHFQTHLVFSTCHIISDDKIGSETIILLETNYCFPRIKFVFPFLTLFFRSLQRPCVTHWTSTILTTKTKKNKQKNKICCETLGIFEEHKVCNWKRN